MRYITRKLKIIGRKISKFIGPIKKDTSKIIHNKSPFAQMVFCGFVIGVGDILCVLADIGWLLGDVSHSPQWYHIPVLTTLVIALIVITWSFLYLYIAVHKYIRNHEKKVNNGQH